MQVDPIDRALTLLARSLPPSFLPSFLWIGHHPLGYCSLGVKDKPKEKKKKRLAARFKLLEGVFADDSSSLN